MAKRAKKTAEPKNAPVAERQDRPRLVRMESSSEPTTAEIDDSGISLEEIGQAYAALLNQGDVPYEEPVLAMPPAQLEATEEEERLAEFAEPRESPSVADEACELSPKSILEAMLFVGHPLNEPLLPSQVAALMRGVTVAEINELVRELNEQYTAEHCPYTIVAEGAGYRLTLHEDFADLRERFYGRVKEARLSQAAIDTLSLVAYHQPVTQKQIDDLRAKPSGGLLSQLVRRQLILLERSPENRKETLYRTTSRFLDLFGLTSLDDLPRSQDIER